MFVPLFYTVTCGGLHRPLHGKKIEFDMMALNGRYPVYTVAHFSCKDKYDRNGPKSRTCQHSGNWNMNSPTCNISNDKFKFA